MVIEKWKDLVGYNGYQCSTLGNIKSFKCNKNGILLKPTLINNYLSAHLVINKHKSVSRLVHRIIAETFLPNPNSYPIINHKNGIKIDNRPENLEWCTPSQNNKHSYDILNRKKTRRRKIENFDNFQLNENEMWKDIIDFPYFKCSDFGNVKNFRFNNKGRLLTQYKNHSGYLEVSLYDYNKHKTSTQLIHRIVAKTFISNINSYPIVNHKNGIKIDNKVENLEWCTHSQNSKHSIHILGNTTPKGEKHGKSKLSRCNIDSIITLLTENKLTQKEIGKIYNVTQNTIGRIQNGERWKHIEYKTSRKRVDLKLSDAQVLEIYKQSWDGKLSQQKIAKQYNISTSLVSLIKYGKTEIQQLNT